MMIVITGGSGSGKSAYAEKRIIELAHGRMPIYYLATMRISGKEEWQKVERHRSLRRGKGFLTIEQPDTITDALPLMTQGKKGVLLECVSNLVANEMFGSSVLATQEAVYSKVTAELQTMRRECEHLVIVTNNVFEDGMVYEDATMEYICALGRINATLAKWADEVWEAVVGIPIQLKE